MNPPLSYLPLLPPLFGIIVGELAYRFEHGLVIPALLLLVAFALSLRRRFSLAFACVAGVIGWIAASVAEPVTFSKVPDKDVSLEGVVVNVKRTPESHVIDVAVESVDYGNGEEDCKEPFKCCAYLPFAYPVVEVGDIVTLGGSYSMPRRQTDLPLENDMQSHYFNRGISLLCYVPTNRFEIRGMSRSPLLRIRRVAEKIEDMIYQSGLNERAAMLMSAIIAGDSAAVDSETRGELAAAGVAHILALSGAHVAVLVALMSLLLFPLAILGYRRLRWIIVIIILWLFATMTGLSASVVRASLMATVVLLALAADRPRSALNSLCLAVIIILLFDPLALYRVGFQLSVLATLSIILWTPRLNPVNPRNRIGYAVMSFVAATLAATIGTLGVVAWYFHSLPLYFLPANLLAVPVMPIMIAGGFVIVVLGCIGFHPLWLVKLLNLTADTFFDVSSFISSLPGAQVSGLYFDGWLLIPLYLGVVALFLFSVKRVAARLVLAIAMFAFIFIASALFRPEYPEEELFVSREKHYTNIIVRKNDHVTVLTTDKFSEIPMDSANLSLRYRDYLATRAVSRFDVVGMEEGLERIAGDDGILRCGGRTIRILDYSPGVEDAVKPVDYLLVTKSFRGNIMSLAESASADTILLACDINKRRRERYYKELESLDRGVRDLAVEPFVISSNPSR